MHLIPTCILVVYDEESVAFHPPLSNKCGILQNMMGQGSSLASVTFFRRFFSGTRNMFRSAIPHSSSFCPYVHGGEALSLMTRIGASECPLETLFGSSVGPLGKTDLSIQTDCDCGKSVVISSVHSNRCWRL
jgi:hypothetical protein